MTLAVACALFSGLVRTVCTCDTHYMVFGTVTLRAGNEAFQSLSKECIMLVVQKVACLTSVPRAS